MRDYAGMYAALCRFFADKLSVEVPSVHTDLVEGGILDSLAFVTLLMHIEEEFGVAVPADALDIGNFRSIAHIVEYVEGQGRPVAHVMSVAPSVL